MARSSSPISEAFEVLRVSSILSDSTPQMLSNSRNVSTADEDTLSAVGGRIYHASIVTVHSLELALDGKYRLQVYNTRGHAGGNMSNKGTTASDAPGIIAAKQFIEIPTLALKGSAYGIFVDGESAVQLEGKNEIDIAGFDKSYGIVVKGGSKVNMGAESITEIRLNGNPVS